jgi:angio-associated migratory cell protein
MLKGTLNGQLIIWDIARQSIRTTCKDDEPTGITRMIWLKNQTILAGTLNGSLKAWDVRSGELKVGISSVHMLNRASRIFI